MANTEQPDPVKPPDRELSMQDVDLGGSRAPGVQPVQCDALQELLEQAQFPSSLWSRILFAADCSGVGPRQIVFMLPENESAVPPVPGPNNIPWDIAIMNFDGSGLVRLTNDGKFNSQPHFAPDGTKIAYTKYAVGAEGDPKARSDVFVYDLTSAQEIQLTHSGISVQPSWSPDGRRIAYGSLAGDSITIMNADGFNPVVVARRAPGELQWGDYAWSRDNWIYFTVAQDANNCFKTLTEKIRPDGNTRTHVSDGGPNCTPPGFEQSGDADDGPSSDGRTIYTSRGFPVHAAGSPQATERKLYAFPSDAWYPGKPERDLSLPSEPSCVEGVPKGSPDGKHVMLFRLCFDSGSPKSGIYLTDTAGSYRTFVTQGFGADWNPVALALGHAGDPDAD
jgi:Tol biopolymer transport system component